MFWNIIGEILWTGILVSLGFFLGHLYTVIDSIVWRVSVVGGMIALIFLIMRMIAYFSKQRI